MLTPTLFDAVVLAAAAALPGVVGSGAGLSLLPLSYFLAFRVRGIFIYFWAAPALCAAIVVLEEGLEVVSDLPRAAEAFLPMVAAVSLHYLAAYGSVRWRVTHRARLDGFAHTVSSYLDDQCYRKKSLPPFLYMKSERVLVALACTTKIVLAITFLVLFFFFNGLPREGPLGCQGSAPPGMQYWAWGLFGISWVTEIMYHASLYLSGNTAARVKNSFALPVLQPTYWQWLFVALFRPTHGIWVALLFEGVRTVFVSFLRMQDKEDALVSPAMWALEVAHALAILYMKVVGTCASYPDAMLFRSLSVGSFFIASLCKQRYKKWKTWSKASVAVEARIYLPVAHKEITCFPREWQQGIKWPADGEEIKFPADHPVRRKFGSDVVVRYFEKCYLSRKETRMQFEDDGSQVAVQFERKTLMPAAWVRLELPKKAGIKIAEKPMSTGLEGQFRVLHPMKDTKGVLAYFGNFGKGQLYAAKRYKKDPGGGYDQADISELASMASEAEIRAAKNRHVRLLKPYFQDCLMQEKAAEIGRAFNNVENLPVKKIEVLRACVVETGWDQELPNLFLVEPYLDDNTPFRKFNNNDFIPGQQAVQNTPNMLSLFSYFSTQKQLLMCDIQGKKYRFTDPQFHSAEKESIDDDDYDDEEERRDWLHSDGGKEMMKRVLLGLYEQKALHALCDRLWPDKMKELSEEVKAWRADPDFQKQIEAWEKEAQMYAKYFSNLNPVLDGGVGGFADMEEELDEAMKGTTTATVGTRETSP